MQKFRVHPDSNYFSSFDGRFTTRFAIKDELPVTELAYPEFYDVKITNYCSGKCPWCYQDSRAEDAHYSDIVGKVDSFFGSMTQNQRPFQVAIGGGNPNEHPDFIKLIDKFVELGITPSYTTNGIGLTPEVIEATRKHCGGVAVSCHPHLFEVWPKAVDNLYQITQLNLHIIISDAQSIKYFKTIYDEVVDKVSHFVLLPYIAQGRAKEVTIDYEALTKVLDSLPDIGKIAFGANFYEYLLGKDYPVSLYEPELFSKYLDLGNMKTYKSSFNLEEVKVGIQRYSEGTY